MWGDGRLTATPAAATSIWRGLSVGLRNGRVVRGPGLTVRDGTQTTSGVCRQTPCARVWHRRLRDAGWLPFLRLLKVAAVTTDKTKGTFMSGGRDGRRAVRLEL
jgi:hypothetical protein